MNAKMSMLFIVVLLSTSFGSLRVRRTDCSHLGMRDCHTHAGSPYVFVDMLTGIWDGYNDGTGFDNVNDDDMGSMNSSVVVETWWIDSLYEPEHDESAPFLYGNVPNPVRRAILWIAGGLVIDEPGDYTFYVGHPDWMWGLLWIDQNGNNKIDFDSNADAVNGNYSGSWESLVTSSDQAYEKTVTFSKAGTYRVVFHSYHRFSNKGWLTVEWKKPGGVREPVPSSTFGTRRQHGLPRAHLSAISVDGTTYHAPFVVLDSFYLSLGIEYYVPQKLVIDQCQTVVFEARAENMLGNEPTFQWHFGNEKAMDAWGRPDYGTLECSGATIAYSYPCAGCVFAEPYVKVQRGDVWSYASKEELRIDINDDTCSILCGQAPSCSNVVSAMASPKDPRFHARQSVAIRSGAAEPSRLYDMRGRCIAAGINAKADKRRLGNVSAGVYIIRTVNARTIVAKKGMRDH
jgi:hypothetical protein